MPFPLLLAMGALAGADAYGQSKKRKTLLDALPDELKPFADALPPEQLATLALGRAQQGQEATAYRKGANLLTADQTNPVDLELPQFARGQNLLGMTGPQSYQAGAPTGGMEMAQGQAPTPQAAAIRRMAQVDSLAPGAFNAAAKLAAGGDTEKLGPGDILTRGGRTIASNPIAEKFDDPISKLLAARERYPEGHPYRKMYDEAIAKANEAAGQPLQEIDDPTSETGKRLVPRNQASGMAGPSSQSPAMTANVLRDEFNKQVEPIKIVSSQYQNAKKGAKAESAAGDMTLVYSLMKALDPGSTVREGEYAQGEQLTGLAGRWAQLYNKAIDGQKLLPDTRKDILGRVGDIYQSQVPFYQSAKSRYTDIAKRQRVRPEDVVTDLPSFDDEKPNLVVGKMPTFTVGKSTPFMGGTVTLVRP